MSRVHPTAIVDSRAELAEDVEVGPYCVLQGPVRIGAGSVLHAHVTILGDTELGQGNRLFPGVVLGAEPQDLKHDGTVTRLRIGDRNQFREHVTVHPGTPGGGGTTWLGSDGLYMVGSHVAHDCRVGDRVVLANHVLLAGHVSVGERAVLNGASACHHFTTIGRLAYVGGLTRVTQDVHPFTVVEGHPARVRSVNRVGLQRAGYPEERIAVVKRAVYAVFLSEKESTAAALARMEREHPDEALVRELLDSVRAAERGRQGRAAEPIGRVT
jgi:UDP-N-acetylglucosamine acyltransferase